MFNRQQHSKMITNSLIMIYLFYILLAALTGGFMYLFYSGFSAFQILLIPIILGFLGFGWGLYNVTYDPLVKWNYVKQSLYMIIAGTSSLLFSAIFIIFSDFIDNSATAFIIQLIGAVLLILTGPIFSISFFILRKDLKPHYFNKYIFKFPNIYTIIAYLAQTVGLALVFAASLLEEENALFRVFFIIGLIINIISIVGLGVGFYPLFISFRTYPKLLEILEEAQLKRQQESASKKAKKAT